MADNQPTERVVLKILNGTQSGSEVALANGEYLLGSGPDDDIQFIDVSLKPGFARLKLAAGTIYIRGGTGSLTTRSGLKSEAGSADWQEIQPLDTITAGTTRFALGLASAQWATIAQENAPLSRPAKAGGKSAKRGRPEAKRARHPVAMTLLGLAVAGLLALRWLSPESISWIAPLSGGPADLELARNALRPFVFADALALRQEVDGTIYLSGFVNGNVERRAVQGAIEKTGVPVRMRIGVLEILRNELDNLIAAEKVSVKGTVTPAGIAVLEGAILDPGKASVFVSRITGDLVGIASVDSQIKTAPMLLADVEKLARISQIDTKVVFRLDKDVVEANGIIGIDKIDAWVGFLQSYSRRFGALIGLRSYVQLQNAAGDLMPAPQANGGIAPILIGPQSARPGKNDVLLDLDKLRRGQFDLVDVLARGEAGLSGPAGPVQAVSVPVRLADSPAALAPATRALVQPAVLLPPGVAALQSAQFLVPAAGGLPYSQSAQPAGANVSDPPPVAVLSPASSAAVGGNPLPAPAGPAFLRGATAMPGVAAVDSAKPKKKFRTGLELPNPALSPASPPATAPPAMAPADGSTASGPAPDPSSGPGYDAHGLMETVSLLFQSWRRGNLRTSKKPEDQSVDQALNLLAISQLNLPAGTVLTEADKGRFVKAYLPLFSSSPAPDAGSLCRGGVHVTRDNIPVALAWLDILSTTDALSLKSFSQEQQEFILEVALSPDMAAGCVRGTLAEKLANNSLYLEEARRNPDFVNFVGRDLPKTDLGVSGINLSGTRFISTRSGDKMREGSAPDGESRVALVGELGVAVRIRTGYGLNVYGPGLNWRNFNN